MGLITPNIIVSNPIPQETIIYYSKDDAVVKFLIALSALSLGIYFFSTDFYTGGIPLCILATILMCIRVKILFNHKPQLILNQAGIESTLTGFIAWDQISKERVTGPFVTGRRGNSYLRFVCSDGLIKVNVDRLNIRPQDLNILLFFYRKRNNNPEFRY